MKTLIMAAIIFTTACGVIENARAQQQTQQAASQHPIIYEGGDGSSYDKAVVIKGAPSDYIGDLAEYNWLAHKYPGYQMNKQSLYYKREKTYDLLEFKTKDNQQMSIYFDISDFIGKGP